MAVRDSIRRFFYGPETPITQSEVTVSQVKESPSQRALAVQRLGQAVPTPKNYESLSKEGYNKNVIAYRSISDIASSAGGVPWLLYNGRGKNRVEVTEHALLKLISKPNPLEGQAAFIEAWVGFLLISGNTYIEAVGPAPTPTRASPPRELWHPRPDRMKIIAGATGLPAAYEYAVGANKVRYACDQVTGASAIMHTKKFNPLHDFYGMSPLEAALLAIDGHNKSGEYNLALLQNSATPSGVLQIMPNEFNNGGTLSDEQFTKLEEKLEDRFSGRGNAGRPMILEGGLSWQSMGFSPSEMSFIESKNISAREIALALGMPPVLVGIQGDSTYNNQKEARLALYTQTIFPMLDTLRDQLNNWLSPMFGDNLYLDYDKDSVDVVADQRAAIWERMTTADYLTPNEKRDAVGYAKVAGGDALMIDAGKIPLEMLGEEPEIEDESEIDDQDEREVEEIEDETELDDDENGEKAIERKAREVNFFEFVSDFIEENAGDKVTGFLETTKKRVQRAIKDAYADHVADGTPLSSLTKGIKEKVRDAYVTMSASRARTIARTETTIGAGEGSRAAAKELGIPNLEKEWVSADDERTRGSDSDDASNHVKMNGVQVPLDKKFSVPSIRGTDEMDGPGDSNAPADQVINCRCVLVYGTPTGKALNLNSPKAKRRHQANMVRMRAAVERKLEAQLKGLFKKEALELLRALDGVDDVKLAESIAEGVIEDMQGDWEKVYRANMKSILEQFGKEVLKLGAKP